MAKVTNLKALQGYFNVGDGVSLEHYRGEEYHEGGVPVKRALRDFADELKALTPEEKRSLAEDVVAVTGDTL